MYKTKINKINKVMAHGTFDLLHSGHFNLLNNASKLGELYVVVRPYDEASILKGVKLAQSDNVRLKNILSLDIVKDAVISGYDMEKSIDLIKKWNIDYVVVGDDHKNNELIKKICEESNTKMVILKRTNGISSTELRRETNPKNR